MRRLSVFIPQADGKLFPLFINRNGVISMDNIVIENIVTEGSGWNDVPQRSYGIPDTNEMRPAFVRIGSLKSLSYFILVA